MPCHEWSSGADLGETTVDNCVSVRDEPLRELGRLESRTWPVEFLARFDLSQSVIEPHCFSALRALHRRQSDILARSSGRNVDAAGVRVTAPRAPGIHDERSRRQGSHLSHPSFDSVRMPPRPPHEGERDRQLATLLLDGRSIFSLSAHTNAPTRARVTGGTRCGCWPAG
jgi:hypothetical protein